MRTMFLVLTLGLFLAPACGDSGVGNGDPDGQAPGPDASTDPVSTALVDTGQDLCYDTDQCGVCPAGSAALAGQDSQYRGRQPSYQDHGDGTVTDLVTGLMWQKSPGPKVTYAEAVAGAAGLDLAGHTDWRLPTIKELYSLILFSGTDPSACTTGGACDPTPFMDDSVFDFAYGDPSAGERLIDSQWATSNVYESTVMNNQECFFGVNFADGRIKCYPTVQKTYFTIYVRGTEGYGENDLADPLDGAVTDRATGLTWQQADSGEALSWEDALAYCEGLTLAGQDDWRLPDAKELQSLVDYSRSPDTTASAAIDPRFTCTPITNEGGAPDYPFYWSSTTHANTTSGHEGGSAAYVSFGRALGYMNGQWMDVHGAGAQRSDPKTGDPADYPTGHGPQGDAIRILNHVRCVRGGAVTYAAGGSGAECPAGGDPVVDCIQAAPGEPCCGDDACAGSENDTNCPADCTNTGPTSCTVQADCEVAGACPAEAALGCTCAPTPTEGNACIPQCNTAQDCPSPPGLTLTCNQDGLCVPEGP